MTEPLVAQKKPYLVTLKKAGRTYFWCACGRSAKQPFCDGSHAGTGIEPVAYKAREDGEEVLLCGCKHTANAPFCDGSHNALTDAYEEASAEEIAATSHFAVTPRSDGETGTVVLDGGCRVYTPDEAAARALGAWSCLPLITGRDGALHLSAFRLTLSGDAGEALTFGDSDAALFVLTGQAAVTLAGRRFDVTPETGVYVRPGETVAVFSTGDVPLSLVVAICPIGPEPALADTDGALFDESRPARTVPVDKARRAAMADRFYQVLVGEPTGSDQVTQFLGEIPRSRAAGHRHLYEEGIMILSGEGYLWTEQARAAVQPGDMIFLPMRQVHSLECTDPGGMRLMGVFYPAGSPAINY